MGKAMFKEFVRRGVFTVLLLSATGTMIAQQPAPSISVTGTIAQPLMLTAADLAQMPRATVTTTAGTVETKWEGVWLRDVLKKVGLPFGDSLRGKALTTYVLAEAQDGYQVVFSIGELDPAFGDNQILLADKVDGKPLFGSDGSFRIIAARDKSGARSVRMLTKLEIVQVKK